MTTETPFFTRLSYSFGNEDWQTEQKALKLKPTDRVLCITGSGDRPLNLLSANPQEVVAIDANPIQNHLLALKKAALSELSFEEYLNFLGAKSGDNREAQFQKVSTQLDQDSKDFWTKNKKMILKGILYQGALEKRLGWMSSTIRWLRPRKVEQLFAFDNLEEQKQYVEKHWDKPLFKKVMKIALHPKLTKPTFNDPGLYANLPPGLNSGAYLYDCIQRYLRSSLAKESLLLSLILNKQVPEEAFAPYLVEKPALFIKKKLSALTPVTADLIEYLEKAPAQSFDAFSMADVASYLDVGSYERLLKAIKRAAKPGARFCLRQFLSAHPMPETFLAGFKREHLLEKQLGDEDRCFVFRFIVGTIQ